MANSIEEITVARNGKTVTLGQSSARLDSILDAAMQTDAELAADYQDILRRLAAGGLYAVIRQDHDGSRDSGCCWMGLQLIEGINGREDLTRLHRLTKKEFRGWSISPAEWHKEELAILRAAEKIGLGRAQYWRGATRTITEYLASAAE